MSAQPNWFKGYVPPAEEWNLWWSKKLDESNPVIVGDLSASVTATGSTTSRLLADRFADWVNVKDFGAKLDGTANVDGAAAGRALASLQPHESVFIPGGTANLIWGQAQGTSPTTPVLFRLDGTTQAGAPILRAFSRIAKGDLFETFYNGTKYFSKRDPEVDSLGVLQIEHLNNTAGGTAGAISIPVRVTAQDSPGSVTSMWGVHVAMKTYSNQDGWPQNVGVSSSLLKYGAAWSAAMHITSADMQNAPSSVGGTLLGFEIGHHADGPDDQFNSGVWGGAGVRQGVGIRQSAQQSSFGELSVGIIVGNDGSNAVTKSVYATPVHNKSYQVFDARGTEPPTGYTDPVAAVRMLAGQIVDFNGGPALNSAAGNYLKYDSATGKLLYFAGGVARWSVDANGNMRCAGTVTGSVTP